MKDPLTFVIESISPVCMAEDGKWLPTVRLKNHSAVTEFVHGRGNRGNLETIVQMHNMTRALLLNGFGVDMTDIVLRSEDVIKEIAKRKQTKDTFTLYANEILALNDLLSLHDAQLDVATTGDIQAAYNRHMKEMRGGKHHRLSTKFIGEKS